MFRLSLFFYLFISLFYAKNDFNHKYFIKVDNFSSGSDYIVEGQRLLIIGAGISFNYNYENFFIIGKFSNNRFYNKAFSRFNDYNGFAWIGNKTENSFDFDDSSVILSYNRSSFSFNLGKSHYKVGGGYRSIIFSEKTPSYPNFNFNWKILKNLDFYYMQGLLQSAIFNDDINQGLYGNFNKSQYDRYIVFHKIRYKADFIKFADIYFGFSESVVYGARGLDLNYLFPFNFYWSIQHYLGDVDNLQMHCFFDIEVSKYSFFYNLLIDEWRPEETFTVNNRNWFGHHMGLSVSDLLFNDKLMVEYVWNDQRIYRHRFKINDYYSYDYPLGFWAGPHSQEILFLYEFKLNPTMSVNLFYSDSKRGELTVNMIESQYDSIEQARFTGLVESKQVVKFSINKEIYTNLSINLGFSYISWINGGFNPYINTSNLYDLNELKNIEKLSINTSLYFNI